MFDDVSASIMLATLLIFLVMIVVLNSMLYKPLLKFMNERNTSISNDEKKVQENFDEVSGFNENLEKIYQETKAEVTRIKQEALMSAKAKAEEEIAKKKAELEERMDAFYTKLSQDKEELKKQLETYLPQWQEALQKNLSKI